MPADEARHHSRWMMRVLEWDDPRARYPNLWRGGMPRHVLAFDTVGERLRLGDLIAVFHPQSQKHSDRSDRFLGISRVVGLHRSEDPKLVWIDLETEHRFDPPLDVGEAPRRVFMCCDPGWPGGDVEIFRRVAAAAVAAGWSAPADRSEEPRRPLAQAPPPPEPPTPPPPETEAAVPEIPSVEPVPAAEAPAETTPTEARTFAGAGYNGDMRDPREGTWLALVEVDGSRLRVTRLEATGRHGLQIRLRNADSRLLRAEAIGLSFPFGTPASFAARLGAPAEEGWWGFAKLLERMTRPDYLTLVQEFRDAEGEPKRWTDEVAGSHSPLHRVNPDLAPMSYHGIRMMAEERSRYAIRPFESAKGRLLLEVSPAAVARRLAHGEDPTKPSRLESLLHALERVPSWPVEFADPQARSRCLVRRDALDAVIAARSAAVAVLSGETDRVPDTLPQEQRDRVHLEGWIYGLLTD